MAVGTEREYPNRAGLCRLASAPSRERCSGPLVAQRVMTRLFARRFPVAHAMSIRSNRVHPSRAHLWRCRNRDEIRSSPTENEFTLMTSHLSIARRDGTTLITLAITTAVLLAFGNAAHAAVVATVPLGTSANYSVLAHTTVTNTGNSRLHRSLGLWPGSSITGFPPGLVIAPGKTDKTNAAAQQAQSDLTAAYLNAAGRSLTATTTANLANLHLQPGVYAGPSKSPLGLTGPLTLDGAGDPHSVFIFQTNSTLITASASTVTLVNGAQECNVFWQVGSSATLGTGSVFAGNILELTSITVTTAVTVHGRALARNGAVTLHNDTFTTPTCAQVLPALPVTTTAPGTNTPGGPGLGLPRTGNSTGPLALLAFGLCVGGLAITGLAKRRHTTNSRA